MTTFPLPGKLSAIVAALVFVFMLGLLNAAQAATVLVI